MAICIAGMHRSGTSMVSRLLYLSGLYLGDESDLFEANQYNQEGYWENSQFVFLNNRILRKYGGSWHSPPHFTPDWESDPEMLLLLEEASELVAEFQPHGIWGWKDPRNSFTLPFWKKIIPDLKIIICVRNPLEVAQSLFKRDGFPEAKSLALWSKSYRSLYLHSKTSQRIVTHYESYHEDALSELHRLLAFIGISAPDSKLEEAVTTIDPNLRHSYHTLLDVEQRFNVEEYLSFLYFEESGSPYRYYLDREMSARNKATGSTYLDSMVSSLGLLLNKAEIEEKLTAEIERRNKIQEELTAEIERQKKIQEEIVAEIERQKKIQEEIATEVSRQESEIKMLSASLQAANQEISRLKSELASIKNSLIWRVARKLRRIRR